MAREDPLGESTVLAFGIGEFATAVSAWVLEGELAARGNADLGLAGLGLRARVLGGAACSSGAGDAPP